MNQYIWNWMWNENNKTETAANMSTEYEYHRPCPKLMPKLMATFIINWILSNRVEFEAKNLIEMV